MSYGFIREYSQVIHKWKYVFDRAGISCGQIERSRRRRADVRRNAGYAIVCSRLWARAVLSRVSCANEAAA